MSEQIGEEYPTAPKNHGSMPFRHLVGFLNQLESNKSSPSQRREVITKLCRVWRGMYGNDIFPCFRLLLPDKDISRIFLLKERRLGSELVEILRIDPKSDDGKAMIKWKQGNVAGAGDFAKRCCDNILKRNGEGVSRDLNLDQVNGLLDALAASSANGRQREVLERMLRDMNIGEIYWMIKIIIKAMKIGISEKPILECWHPSASRLFDITSDLKRVCWQLYDPSVSISTKEIRPFSCFKPQVANFAMKDYNELISKIGVDMFYIEEKYDGERLQLHMRDGEFKYFSRSGIETTKRYGSSYSQKGTFTSFIKGFLNDNVRSVILDGEILSWNEIEGKVEGFNKIKSAINLYRDLDNDFGSDNKLASNIIPIDDANNDIEASESHTDQNEREQDKWKDIIKVSKTLSHRPPRHGYYIIYDILHLNGETLITKQLKHRRSALQKIIKPIDKFVEVIKYDEGSQKKDITKRFLEVMEQGGEGLVIKNPDSPYGVNMRDNSWIKVKPEYIDGLGENFDLLIIGGYYGNGSRSGKLSSFLCGVRNSDKDEEDKFCDESEKNIPTFFSICNVGTGFTSEHYELLHKLFEGKTHSYNSSEKRLLPNCVDLGEQIPDVWIHPRDSIVIKVKATEITDSKPYSAKVSFRFPRFTGFRYDKNWKTATSLTQLKKIQKDFDSKRKLQEEKLDSSNVLISKGRSHSNRSNKRLKIIGRANETKVYGEHKISDIFQNYKFHILSKQLAPGFLQQDELKRLIQCHSGAILPKFEYDEFLEYRNSKSNKNILSNIILIADLNTISVSSICRKFPQQLTILRPVWIHRCISAGKIVSIEPQYQLVSSPSDSFFARCQVDRFGDSYYHSSSLSDFKVILQKALPSSINLGIDKDLFHNALSAFAKTVELIDSPCEPCASGLLFAQSTIYFDFEEQTSKHISHNEIPCSNISQYSPWLPSVSSSKGVAHFELTQAKMYAKFGGAVIVETPFSSGLTTIVYSSEDPSRVQALRKVVAFKLFNGDNAPKKMVHFVTSTWITQCWKEKTQLPEENFTI